MAMTVGEFKNMVSFMLDHPEKLHRRCCQDFYLYSEPYLRN